MPPPTVFERPLAALLPDPKGPRQYANVSNLLEVAGVFSQPYQVAVAVPTELFSFMRDIARIPPEEPVSLALDKVDDWYVFSLLSGDSLFDLWHYSKGSIPAWILDRKRAVT